MADMTRGERTVQLFAKVISNPGKKFTVTDLMNAFNIPDEERRNVQRDMRFLSEMDGGRYITVENEGRTSVYRSALPNAERLLFSWVVSFSDVARVIKPVSLRKWLKEYAEYLMENYG